MTAVFTRLLLATEHGEQDEGAERVALALAKRGGLPLDVVLPLASNPEYEAEAPALAARAEGEAARRLAALEAAAAHEGIRLRPQVRRHPEPYRAIVETAHACEADLIVIRRRGRRGLLANLLLGEMVRNVVAHAPCSVLVTPRAAGMWSHRVLAAIDPQAEDFTPLRLAAAMAVEGGLPMSVVAVCERGAEAERRMHAVLDRAARAAASAGIAAQCLPRTGRAHEAVIAAARSAGADLLVIGRHGEEALTRAWLGGVAQKLIGLADIPVLVALSSPSRQSSHP